jgi:hypothetical protein
VLAAIKRVVADYANAPDGIENYRWVRAPRYWDRMAIPGANVSVEPRHDDQHAGVAFRVGWNEAERVAVVWLL